MRQSQTNNPDQGVNNMDNQTKLELITPDKAGMIESNLIGTVKSVAGLSGVAASSIDALKQRVILGATIGIRSTLTGQVIIAKIIAIDFHALTFDFELVGTYFSRVGLSKNVFKNTCETMPSVEADCWLIENKSVSL